MSRAVSVNLVLSGMLIGTLVTWACGPDNARADGDGTPAQMITADTDISRMERGVVPITYDAVTVVAGPIIITDLLSGESPNFWISVAGDCADVVTARWSAGADMAPTGLRLTIEAGEQLCVNDGSSSNEGVLWTGFRPY